MQFPTSQFAQSVKNAYLTVWTDTPRTEEQIQLMQPEHQIALRFYDYIRLRLGEKIPVTDLIDIGIPMNELFDLFLLVYLKQGAVAINMYINDDVLTIIYSGMQSNQ